MTFTCIPRKEGWHLDSPGAHMEGRGGGREGLGEGKQGWKMGSDGRCLKLAPPSWGPDSTPKSAHL